MYVSASFKDKSARYIDLSDIEFFKACIQEAIDLLPAVLDVNMEKDTIKQRTPICHISKLSKQKSVESIVDRKYLHTDRARRGFIMGDVDYEAHEVEESEAFKQALISFAQEKHTPLLIYPTASYPEKPRFRWVMFTKRIMAPTQYHKAMKYVYDTLGFSCTDKSDFDIRANRNLPIFDSQAQVDGIYSTLDDITLEALDNALFKDVQVPKKKLSPVKIDDPTIHGTTLNSELVLKAAEELATTPICAIYNSFWRVVKALAAAVLCEGIDEATARQALIIFAKAAPDANTKYRWEQENQILFDKQAAYLRTDADFMETQPLIAYGNFARAIV